MGRKHSKSWDCQVWGSGGDGWGSVQGQDEVWLVASHSSPRAWSRPCGTWKAEKGLSWLGIHGHHGYLAPYPPPCHIQLSLSCHWALHWFSGLEGWSVNADHLTAICGTYAAEQMVSDSLGYFILAVPHHFCTQLHSTGPPNSVYVMISYPLY